MNDIELFLAHAICLERDAARRFEELAATMQTAGNAEVERFFRKMALFSRQHLAEASARGGFRELPEMAPSALQWPDGCSPEQADWMGVDGLITPAEALALALDSERRGLAYYSSIAAITADPEVKRMALAFAAEEAEHVAELERWCARAATPS